MQVKYKIRKRIYNYIIIRLIIVVNRDLNAMCNVCVIFLFVVLIKEFLGEENRGRKNASKNGVGG